MQPLAVIPIKLPVERLRAHQGTEFTDEGMAGIEAGVHHHSHTSADWSIEARRQEEPGERLANTTRCMPGDSGLPNQLWG